MELRSHNNKKEFSELKKMLSGMGYYEEGMGISEMREMVEALQLSSSNCNNDFDDNDIMRAIRESEQDFLPSYAGVFNSTLVSSDSNEFSLAQQSDTRMASASLDSSMELTGKQCVVIADVHHEQDWSPPKPEKISPSKHNLNVRKRLASLSDADMNNCSKRPMHYKEDSGFDSSGVVASSSDNACIVGAGYAMDTQENSCEKPSATANIP